MVHEDRRFVVSVVDSPESLARKLTKYDWTVCTGFSVAGRGDVLFLNDSFAGGGSEYAIVARDSDGNWRQVESITFSACTEAQAIDYINKALAGEMEPFSYSFVPNIETLEEHRGSACCA